MVVFLSVVAAGIGLLVLAALLHLTNVPLLVMLGASMAVLGGGILAIVLLAALVLGVRALIFRGGAEVPDYRKRGFT